MLFKAKLNNFALKIDIFTSKYLQVSALGVICISITMFAIMLIVNSYNIFLRWMFNKGITWHQEISMMAAMWIYFAAFALISKNQGYIRISFIVDRLRPSIKKIVFTINRLLIIGFHTCLLILVITEIKLVSIQRTFILEWPEYFFYIPLAVGTGDIIITELLLFIRHIGGLSRNSLSTP